MPGPQRGRLRHQRLARGPVDHVGEEHGERALPVAQRRGSGTPPDSRTPPAGPSAAASPSSTARSARRPAARRHVALDGVGEDQQPDVVVVLHRGVGQVQRRRDHRLQPRHPVHLRRQQPAGVDHEHHLLPPLVLVLPRDRLAPARGRLPVDDPGVVARHPLPEPLEEPALAAVPHAAEPRLAPPHGLDRQRPQRGAEQAGIDGRAPGRLDPALPPGQAERAENPQIDRCRPRRCRGAPARSSSCSSTVRPGGSSSTRSGVSAPPSGSGRRSLTSHREPSPGGVPPAVAHRRSGARARRRPAPRAARRARARPVRRARRRRAPGPRARRAASSTPSASGRQQAGRRDQRRAPPAPTSQRRGRNQLHRGASIFSMMPRSAVSGRDALQLQLRAPPSPGGGARRARAPSRRRERRTPGRRAAPRPAPS